jgi:hypothetical protein
VIRCPVCRAIVEAGEEEQAASCASCGAMLSLDAEGAHLHGRVPPRLLRTDLPARLGSWIQDLGALGRPTHVRTRLLYVPFWTEGASHPERHAPAAALPVWDLQSFRLPASRPEPFTPPDGEAEVVAPGIPSDAALGSHVLAGASRRLVHLPFWEVAFRLGDRSHAVWIDATRGQVFPLSAPASAEPRLDRIYALFLGAVFVVLTAGFLGIFSGGARAGIGLALLGITWPLATAIGRRLVRLVEEG